jgi:catechol 2,3-dioxygenase-like lactoylglutathione lyase family enzyme
VLHHITLWVPDLERAEVSWSWLLGRLGYERDGSVERVVLLRHPAGIAVVLEQSTDMVPGMLYSRLRPGLNHMAFRVESSAQLAEIAQDAQEYGWASFPSERHPIAGGAEVVYLEDRDGFEVELVAVTPG